MRFRDRADAGRQLAAVLQGHHLADPIVIGLARGGLPVAEHVAWSLHAPLDVFIVRKVGAPHHAELAIGAVAEGGIVVRNTTTMTTLGVSEQTFSALAKRAQEELERRVAAYRHGKAPLDVTGSSVVLVDDGLATGVTAEAAALALRRRSPSRLVLAVPVASHDAVERLQSVVDEVICLLVPDRFEAVGLWYGLFDQTSDDEVVAILEQTLGSGLGRRTR